MKEMNINIIDKTRIDREIKNEIKKYNKDIEFIEQEYFEMMNDQNYQENILTGRMIKNGKITACEAETIGRYVEILSVEADILGTLICEMIINRKFNHFEKTEYMEQIKKKLIYMDIKLQEWDEKIKGLYLAESPFTLIQLDIFNLFFKDFERIIYIVDYEIPNAVKILKTDNANIIKEYKEIIDSEISRVSNTIHLLGECLSNFINKNI